MKSAYLMHHGVKGQKWGVRKYQNEDGTYTAAGKKHRNEIPSVSNNVGSGAAGGGGGAESEKEELEEWEKSLYQDVDDTLKANPGLFTYDQLTDDDWQDFRVTLSEFAGVDTDSLSSKEIERMRSKVKAHYGTKHSDEFASRHRNVVKTTGWIVSRKH